MNQRHVVIAGGSGLIGRALATALVARGDRVTIASRSGTAVAGAGSCRYDALPADIDAVVNLAGANIVGRRWTPGYKRELFTSRVDFTRDLIARVHAARAAPSVWLNASAVGIYGDRGADRLDEDSPLAAGFLPELCRQWEAAAATAATLGARVAVLRIGIVLAREGGALKKMELPFRLFAGGPIGNGQQFMSWIHRDDLVRLFVWALEHVAARGTYNATAPEPCTNLELSRALARALRRPCFLPVPRFALRLALGEVAAHLWESQRVLPARALEAGFAFQHPRCAEAIGALYDR